MSPSTTQSPPPRPKRGKTTNPCEAWGLGLPDPRPLTDYIAEYAELDGHSRINITLDSPCIIRAPAWVVIDVRTGETIPPDAVKATSPTELYLDYTFILGGSVCLVEVPYQDMQVQNFQGGFVRPGAKVFRTV